MIIYRADGRCVCEDCGLEYRQHPVEEHPWALAAEDRARLHRLCNGHLVKT